MGRAVILARVSTDIQSLDSQVEKLIEEAKRLGYDDYVVVQAHESGVKLDTEERQTIQAMKDEIEKGGVDMVIIWEVSRLARRPKVLYEVREYLIKHNVNLRCMTPAFTMLQADGNIDPTASIVFAIFGTMAEQEAILSKQRMKRGRIAKRERLGFIGGNVMLGYKVKDDKVVIDEDEAVIVREIFKRYVGGESLRAIATDLIDRGDIRYDSVDTACVTLRRMIRRSEYAGIKMETYDYPAIISTELWEQVRSTAKERDTMKVRTKTKVPYFGRNIVIDGLTGRMMTPCAGINLYSSFHVDSKHKQTINLNLADSILAWAAQSWWRHKMTGKMDEELEQSAIEYRKKKLKLDKDHAELKKKIDRSNDRIIDGKMDEARGDAMIATIKEDLKKVESNIIEMEDKVNTIMEQRMRILSGNASDIYSMPDEDASKFVHECVERMVVTKGDKLRECRVNIIYKDSTETALYVARRGNYFDVLQNGTKLDIRMLERITRKKRLR